MLHQELFASETTPLRERQRLIMTYDAGETPCTPDQAERQIRSLLARTTTRPDPLNVAQKNASIQPSRPRLLQDRSGHDIKAFS